MLSVFLFWFFDLHSGTSEEKAADEESKIPCAIKCIMIQ